MCAYSEDSVSSNTQWLSTATLIQLKRIELPWVEMIGHELIVGMDMERHYNNEEYLCNPRRL